MLYASSLGPAGAAGPSSMGSLRRVAVWFWEAGPSPGQGMAIALPSPSVPDGLCRGTAPLGRRRSPPWRCWCKSAAAGLLAASFTLPLLVINPALVQGKTLCSSKHDMDCLLTPAAWTVPDLGAAGMYTSPRGASTLQSKQATAKPSAPFAPDTVGTSKVGESRWESSGKEGASSPTTRPSALELRRMGTTAASAGRRRLWGRMLKRACQFSLCLVYSLLLAPLCREKLPEV